MASSVLIADAPQVAAEPQDTMSAAPVVKVPHDIVLAAPIHTALHKPATTPTPSWMTDKRTVRVQNLARFYVNSFIGGLRLQRDKHSITLGVSPDEEATTVREETIDTFLSLRLPFASYSIDCRYVTSSFSPLRCSLTMTQHIDPDSDLLHEISWMLNHGDVDKFERLRADNRLSPYCQIQGLTLLQVR